MAIRVAKELDFGGIGRVVVGRFSDQALDALRGRPDVRYVEPDYPMTTLAQRRTWGIDRIDADVTRSDGHTGGGVDVAVLDTGIDSDHPDLDANLGAGKAFIDCGTTVDGSSCSSNAGSCDQNWDDDEGHGTHAAGSVGAVDNSEGVYGVSSTATIHAVKVMDCTGNGSSSDLVDGLKYVADQGWDVANMSLGFGFDSNGDPINPSSVQNAVEYADKRNVLQVAAAGNDGETSVCDDDQCVAYPAAYTEVVAVSALMKDDDIAPYSNRGDEIELGAPGGGDHDGDGNDCTPDPGTTDMILSTYPTESSDYVCMNGTSMASPHVAGAAAVAKGAATLSNHRGVRDRLDATAEDVGLHTDYQGNGLVDVELAVSTVTEWTYDPGHRLQYSSPAIDGSRVYVAGLGADVTALNRGDGSVDWSFSRDGALADSTPVVSGSHVLVGSGGGSVYRLATSDGSVDWSHSTSSAHVSSPAVSGGVVYVGSNDGTVLALEESTGNVKWAVDVGGAVYSKPVVASGTVFVATNGGQLVALATSDGNEEWRFDTGSELGHAGAAVGNGRVFVGADDVYARDQADGSAVWSQSTFGGTAGSTPAYDGTTGYVFVGSADGDVYALDDADSGSVVWSFATGGSVGGSPTLVGESVLAGADDGVVYLLDTATGRQEDEVAVAKTRGRVAVGSTETFVGTWNGSVEKLSSLVG